MEYANEDIFKFFLRRIINEVYKSVVTEQTLREKKGVNS